MATNKASSDSGANRRKHERIDAKIEVQFRSGNEFVSCYTQNLSKGGIYLETEVLPDPNAIVELVLGLPFSDQSAKTISLKGRVARLMSVSENKKTIHKVGIQFLDIPPQAQIQLDMLYEHLKK